MKKIEHILLSTLFIACIFIVGIFMVFTPEKEVSEIENRQLAQQPELTTEGFIDGKYMSEFEEYFTDQFPGRNVWLKSYLNYQQLTGQTYLYKYYVSDDSWIYPKPKYDFPKEPIKTAAEKVNEFGEDLEEKGIEFYYFSAPHKESTMDFLLPSYIDISTANKKKDYFMSQLSSEKVSSLDMTSHFQSFSNEKLKDLYFKTDHHWNGNGALEGYKLMVEKFMEQSSHFNGSKVEKRNYEEKCLDSKENNFVGSYNKQLYKTINVREEMCSLFPSNFSNYEVTLDGKQVKPEDIYGRAFFKDKKDKVEYTRLYTSDLKELTITNPAKKEEGKKILIIKDSYANALSFLVPQDFYQTTIYDPRHNQDRTVQEYVDENDFDIVVMLYNSTHVKGWTYNLKTRPQK